MRRRFREGSAPITLFSFQDLITSLSGILILLVLLMSIEVAMRKVSDVTASAKDIPDHSAAIARLRSHVAELKRDFSGLKQTTESQTSLDAVEYIRQEEAVEKIKQGNNALHQQIDSLQETRGSLEKRLRDALGKDIALNDQMRPLKEELVKLQTALEKTSEIFFIPEKGDSKTPVLVECSGITIRVGYVDRNKKPAVFAATSSGIKEFEKSLSDFSTRSEYFVFMIKPSGVKCFDKVSTLVDDKGFEHGYDALDESASIGFGGIPP